MASTLVPMRRTLPLLLGVLLVIVPLAGCIGGSGSANQQSGADDVDNATNQSFEDVKNATNNTQIEVNKNQEFDPSSTVHPHDYWNGRESVTIIDEANVEANWGERLSSDPVRWSTQPKFTVDVQKKTGPEGQIIPNMVFPGTGSIDITLSWSGSTTNGVKLCLTNQGAGDRSNFCRSDGQAEHTYQTSGETWTITKNDTDRDNEPLIGPETWDEPHSLKSDWRFQVHLCAGTQTENPCPPATSISGFTLTVTVNRGSNDLPIDPPHFAFYNEKESLTVIPEHTREPGPSAYFAWSRNLYPRATNNQDQVQPVASGYYNGFLMTTDDALKSGTPVVSWETSRLVATLSWTTNGEPENLEMKYRTASDAWGDPWRSAEQFGECSNQECVYDITVTQTEADSPYAAVTQWEFGIFSSQDVDNPSWLSFTFEVVTYKDSSAGTSA